MYVSLDLFFMFVLFKVWIMLEKMEIFLRFVSYILLKFFNGLLDKKGVLCSYFN